jgi:hypothetical protein
VSIVSKANEGLEDLATEKVSQSASLYDGRPAATILFGAIWQGSEQNLGFRSNWNVAAACRSTGGEAAHSARASSLPGRLRRAVERLMLRPRPKCDVHGSRFRPRLRVLADAPRLRSIHHTCSCSRHLCLSGFGLCGRTNLSIDTCNIQTATGVLPVGLRAFNLSPRRSHLVRSVQ